VFLVQEMCLFVPKGVVSSWAYEKNEESPRNYSHEICPLF